MYYLYIIFKITIFKLSWVSNIVISILINQYIIHIFCRVISLISMDIFSDKMYLLHCLIYSQSVNKNKYKRKNSFIIIF